MEEEMKNALAPGAFMLTNEFADQDNLWKTTRGLG